MQKGNIGKSCTFSTDFFELAELTNILMNENNLNEPTNAQEGLISNQTSNFCWKFYIRCCLKNLFIPKRHFYQ